MSPDPKPIENLKLVLGTINHLRACTFYKEIPSVV